MKISIQEIAETEEEEILIKCHKVDENVMAIVKKVGITQKKITGMSNEKIYNIPVNAVYYYETVENKAFLYTKDKVFETKLKLFQFEQEFCGDNFFRASKSVVLNVSKIAYIKPSISGRFEATLDNQEKIMVSRQYVVELKRLLGM